MSLGQSATNFLKYLFFTVILGLLAGCAGPRPNLNIPAKMPPVPNYRVKKQGVILVLGSGGARGYAHIGVLQALEAAHIPVDGIVCASAGCLIGALYADNLSARKTYEIMMHAGFWDFADVGNLPSLSGIISGVRFEKFLIKHMHAKNFKALKIPLITAATDLKTGKPFLIQSGPVAPAALASAAIPGAVRPVHLYGHVLVDGGVAAPVPAKAAQQFDPAVVIAVDIAQELPKKLPFVAYGIYSRAYDIMWERLTNYSQKDADVVIRPRVGQTGTFDIADRYSMYLAGYRAGKRMVPKIEKLLAAKHIALAKKKFTHSF